MLSEILRHWRYFIPKFVGYGGALGTLFGALTYPIFGAFIGAPWGLLAGLLLGILMGIGVPIYNERYAPDNSHQYQTQLTFGAGMLTILVMAIPLAFIYALPAGMVAAYMAHQYSDNPIAVHEKRKHNIDMSQKRERVFPVAITSLFSKGLYVIPLGIIMVLLGYAVLSNFEPFSTFDWIAIPFISITGALYGFIIAAIIAITNALFIVMANRLFFDVDMPKSQYKPRIIASVSVLTLFLSMIVTAGIGAPFAAIAGALGAAKYADWYYEPDAEEKAKRSADRLTEDETVKDDFTLEEIERERASLP